MYNGIKEAIKKIESPYLLVGLYSTLKTGEFFSISPRLTASLSLICFLKTNQLYNISLFFQRRKFNSCRVYFELSYI